MTPTGIAGWFGLAVLVVGLPLALLQIRKGAKGGIPLSLITLLIGVVLIQAYRLEEVLLGDVGQIKFAKDQALADASEVAQLRQHVEQLVAEAERSIARVEASVTAVQDDLADQRQFGSIAKIDWDGDAPLGTGGISVGTGYSSWNRLPDGRPIVRIENDPSNPQISVKRWRCDAESVTALRSATSRFPQLPFPHVFLADCLKRNGDSAWADSAATAQQILTKTTKVPGHAPAHDDFLRLLDEYGLSQSSAIPPP
jgi:hypothetical protein